MIAAISYLLIALAALLALPAAILLFEIVGALIRRQPRTMLPSAAASRPRVAVLIPAHNEGAGLRPTVQDVRAQLRTGDRLVVVADNCTDETAGIAAAAGAEVIERRDPTKVGKGYALDFGLKHLCLDPPKIVIIIDADCRVSEGTIHRLIMACAETGRPEQALYLMRASPESSINFRVAEFAWQVKNWVRPLGLAAFNLPCQMMGTGMAIPWAVLRSANLANGSLVEDLVLGLKLSQAGSSPVFCPSALVTSRFPLSVEGTKSQRYRWEQGHIHLIVTAVPRYLFRSIVKGNLSLLALILDLAVPPISLFMTLLIAMLIVTGLAILLGLPSVAFTITACTFAAFVLSILLAWWKFGRDVLPIRSSALVLSYVIAKLPMYCRTLIGNITTHWTRTDRKSSQ